VFCTGDYASDARTQRWCIVVPIAIDTSTTIPRGGARFSLSNKRKYIMAPIKDSVIDAAVVAKLLPKKDTLPAKLKIKKPVAKPPKAEPG
jgi:hypothetical protein